ncbi:SET and MYND domain-containing protein 4-like protein [Leptotrombidium deliense]|uniref:Protein-lysine N-methyltransferase SMYD4 n=1 Tax=Leptotrombidium deliense TaxID=299467 RepID=A0A443S587_9ACAR|nr:SET and MYND domain-containing protein 4-like protein [Leptotrombidium deliense]
MVEIKEIEESKNDQLPIELKNLISRVNKYFTDDEVRCKARYNIDKANTNWLKKSEERFKKHKMRGNNLFADGNYNKAIEEYSQAIIWAMFPPESDNQIGFAFGNRSAALCKIGLYSQCIQDIDLAMKYGYPSEQKEKLIKRKQFCLQHIEKETKCRNKETQRCEENIKQKEGEIVAVHSLKKGDIVFIEDSWCTSLDKDYYFTHCYNCFNKIDAKTLFPCFTCSKVRFCCESCSIEAWNKGHKYECQFLDIWSTLFFEISKNPVQLAANMILRADVSHAIEAVRNGNDNSHEYEYNRILKLKDAGENCKDFSKSAALLLTYFSEFAKLPQRKDGQQLRDDIQLFGGLLLKHLQQIQLNAVPILEHDFTTLMHESTKLFQESAIGYGIYTLYNSLKHSCDPNAKITAFDGRRLILRAVKDIAENEVITVSFGVTYKSHTSKERQKFLRENYFFDCNCFACNSEYQSKCNAFLCSECKNTVNYGQSSCPKCEKAFETVEEIDLQVKQIMMKAKSGALALVYKEPDLWKAEHLLVESYRSLIDILCPLNKKIGFISDKLSLCYKLMKKHHLSLKFIVECIECVREEIANRQAKVFSYSFTVKKQRNKGEKGNVSEN